MLSKSGLKILLVRNLDKGANFLLWNCRGGRWTEGRRGEGLSARFATDFKFGKTVWTCFCALIHTSHFLCWTQENGWQNSRLDFLFNSLVFHFYSSAFFCKSNSVFLTLLFFISQVPIVATASKYGKADPRVETSREAPGHRCRTHFTSFSSTRCVCEIWISWKILNGSNLGCWIRFDNLAEIFFHGPSAQCPSSVWRQVNKLRPLTNASLQILRLVLLLPSPSSLHLPQHPPPPSPPPPPSCLQASRRLLRTTVGTVRNDD